MENNKIAKLIEPFDLDLNRSTTLIEKFGNIFEIAEGWANRLAEINISDITDKEKSIRGKEALKIITKKINEIEITRKEIKEPALREGQAIDKVSNIIKDVLNPLKALAKDLSEIEDIKEAKRLIELSEKRRNLIADYADFITVNIDFGTMSEQDFIKTFDAAKLAKTSKIENEKIEAERKQKEKEENERLKVENERLIKEAEIKAKALDIERKRANEKIEAERKQQAELLAKQQAEAKETALIEAEKQAKIQAELKAKADAERKKAEQLQAELKAKADDENKAKAEQLQAEKKALNANDKTKLISLAESFKSVQIPSVKSDEVKAILQQIEILQSKLVNYIIEKSNSI